MATIDWDNLSSGEEEEQEQEESGKIQWKKSESGGGGGGGGGIDWDNLSSGEEEEEEDDDSDEATPEEAAMRARLFAALEEETREYEQELQEKEEKRQQQNNTQDKKKSDEKKKSKVKLPTQQEKNKKEKKSPPIGNFERRNSLSNFSQGLLRRSDGHSKKSSSKKQIFFTKKESKEGKEGKEGGSGIHKDTEFSFEPPTIPSYMVHHILEQQTLAPPQENVPLRQGFLLKTTPNKIQKKAKNPLKQRWVVLYPSKLVYFEKFFDESSLGFVKTSDINNITDFQSKFTNSLKLSGFQIECKDTTYVLFAENEKSKQEWMSSLKKATNSSMDAWGSVRTAMFVVETGGSGKKMVRANVDLSYDEIRKAVAEKTDLSILESKELWDVAQNEWLRKSMETNPISARANEKIVLKLQSPR